MVFSKDERVFIIESYFAYKSYERVKDEFRLKFPNSAVPNNTTITRLINKFRETGSVQDRKSTGRPSVLTEQVLDNVKQRLTTSPRKSLRKLSVQAGLSLSSTFRATKKLNLRPYRIGVVHELKDVDHGKRIQYCRWIRSLVNDNGIEILDRVYFSDEAWFHLDGYVNSQNCRIWSAENPHAFQERPLHARKIGVWCAISRRRIVGPLFFDKSVDGVVYRNLIEQFIALLELHDRDCWFQQDNATCHTSAETMNMLREFFDHRVISKGLWPPRSPDLTPADFFLWGNLKSKVFNNNPHTLDELKANIESEIKIISEQTLRKVAANVMKRVRTCITSGGSHFEHLL